MPTTLSGSSLMISIIGNSRFWPATRRPRRASRRMRHFCVRVVLELHAEPAQDDVLITALIADGQAVAPEIFKTDIGEGHRVPEDVGHRGDDLLVEAATGGAGLASGPGGCSVGTTADEAAH